MIWYGFARGHFLPYLKVASLVSMLAFSSAAGCEAKIFEIWNHTIQTNVNKPDELHLLLTLEVGLFVGMRVGKGLGGDVLGYCKKKTTSLNQQRNVDT